METQKLTDGIRTIAWAYLILLIDFRLGTVNLLPDWLGYGMILSALPGLGGYAPAALLLRRLGIALALWEGALWVVQIWNAGFEPYLPGLAAAVIALYFHFQLLTNLAEIAEQFGLAEQRRILILRTVSTLFLTCFALPFPFESQPLFAIAAAIAHGIVALWICLVLFSLHSSLTRHIDAARQ